MVYNNILFWHYIFCFMFWFLWLLYFFILDYYCLLHDAPIIIQVARFVKNLFKNYFTRDVDSSELAIFFITIIFYFFCELYFDGLSSTTNKFIFAIYTIYFFNLLKNLLKDYFTRKVSDLEFVIFLLTLMFYFFCDWYFCGVSSTTNTITLVIYTIYFLVCKFFLFILFLWLQNNLNFLNNAMLAVFQFIMESTLCYVRFFIFSHTSK